MRSTGLHGRRMSTNVVSLALFVLLLLPSPIVAQVAGGSEAVFDPYPLRPADTGHEYDIQ